jgi:long-chain acyl-CoA synthetase
VEVRTLSDIFYRSVEELRKPQHLRVKRAGVWQDINSDDVRQAVEEIAAGLRAIGVEPGGHVAILSENRPEWAYVDLAVLCARAVVVPIHTTLTPRQTLQILNNSEATVLFVSNEVQARKVAEVRSEMSHVQRVFSMDAVAGIPHVDDVRSKGRSMLARQPGWVKAEASRVTPGDVATLIYTSGTTGEPKGVMLTHDNITHNVQMASSCFVNLSTTDTALSMLPLSHIFERMCGHFLMLSKGCTIAYGGPPEEVAGDMLAVRPTIIFSVPRFYEKIYARIREKVAADPPLRQKVFRWAVDVGRAVFEHQVEGTRPDALLRLKHAIADRLVFSKVRTRTGGRVRVLVSGGAPLAKEISDFFGAAGLVVLEGYGLTETSPVIAVSSIGRMRPGTVGPPIDDIEVRIADDGEILTRGRNVMKGYFKDPEATAAAVDTEGWLHTGDIGVLEGGFLKITDRKKDLIVTSGGKNIAPQPVEYLLKAAPEILEVMMLGNKRHFPAALIVPHFDNLRAWAAGQSIVCDSNEALIAHPQVIAHYESIVAEKMASFAQFERIKKIALLPKEFSIDSGELTPKLSVKRRVVEEKYKAIIDRMYESRAGAAQGS